MVRLTVALYGGLGNQLFQYAVGKALSLRLGVPLAFDHFGFEFDKLFFKRTYEISHFMVPCDASKIRSPALFLTSRLLFRLARWQPAISHFLSPGLIIEKYRTFCEDIFPQSLEKEAYMMGYWQDERYFLNIRDIILQEFKLRGVLSSSNKILKDTLNKGQTVAVHIRRLHNVPSSASAVPSKDPEARGVALGVSYYQKAVEEIAKRVSKPEFFVFSDFPPWARENISFNAPTHFLEPGRGPDYEDLVLMSHCHHHIVANSSFSWWGAWLAQKENQIVIAPRNAKFLPTIPEAWIKI